MGRTAKPQGVPTQPTQESKPESVYVTAAARFLRLMAELYGPTPTTSTSSRTITPACSAGLSRA